MGQGRLSPLLVRYGYVVCFLCSNSQACRARCTFGQLYEWHCSHDKWSDTPFVSLRSVAIVAGMNETLLEVQYPFGPGTVIAPNSTLSSFRTYTILQDTDDLERQSLQRRKMVRMQFHQCCLIDRAWLDAERALGCWLYALFHLFQ